MNDNGPAVLIEMYLEQSHRTVASIRDGERRGLAIDAESTAPSIRQQSRIVGR